VKRKKKVTLAKVRRLTLALWSKKVRQRAEDKCEVCGKPEGFINPKGNPVHLNAHHIEDKANQRLRFDIDNGIALCPSCHKFGRDSAHRSPIWFVEWLLRYATPRYSYVLAHRKEPPPDRAGVEGLFKKLGSE